MPLPIPTLDDLMWSELVDEARDRIPSTADRWTDHNAHDPGITVLELMAWACEQIGYRIDQVPLSHRRAFLALLGVTSKPSEKATAVLQVNSAMPIEIGSDWRVVAEVEGVKASFAICAGAQSSQTRVVELRSDDGSATPRTSQPSSTRAFEPFGPDGESTLTIVLEPAAPSGVLTCWFESAHEGEAARSSDGVEPATRSRPELELQWECSGGQGWRTLATADIEDRTTCLTRSGTVSLDIGGPGVTMLRCRLARGRYDRAPALVNVLSNAVIATACVAGAASNLPPDAAWTIEQPAVLAPGLVSLSAPFGSRGGRDEEAVEEALGRAAIRLSAHERLVSLAVGHDADTLDRVPRSEVLAAAVPARAVTLLDLERVAFSTPGAGLARVRALADLDLHVSCAEAPGTVSVIIVPFLPVGRPEPTPDLVARVTRHLVDHKTLGTRIRVFGPSYATIDIAVSAIVARGVDRQVAKTMIERAIRMFLDPLLGGPGNHGWPFGRDVYRTEIMALIGALPGVELVTDVHVTRDGSDACANACVSDGDLVDIGSLTVSVI